MSAPDQDLVYLDNNATTAVAPEVLDALLPWLREGYGNPSSKHAMGEPAARAVALARASVARMLGAQSPREVVFTSGGTESINSALFACLRARPEARRIVTTTAEHSAALNPAKRLAEEGFEVAFVGVDAEGRVDVDGLIAALTPETAVCTLLWGNNETGVLIPDDSLARVSARCRELEIPLHLDAVQVAGKRPIDVSHLGCDLLSISGHKFHGPKGVGAIWVRSGTAYTAHVEGGTQEEGRRGGTLNTPGIVGLGEAARLAARHTAEADSLGRLAELRDALEQGLLERIPDARVNGAGAERVESTSNISFEGVRGDALLLLLSEFGVCVSTGAACSTGKRAPSHVLLAMGLSPELAGGSIRLSLSRYSTEGDVDRALERVPRAVEQLRAMAPRP